MSSAQSKVMSPFLSHSEIESLLKMAADKGVDEAKKALRDLYPHKYS